MKLRSSNLPWRDKRHQNHAARHFIVQDGGHQGNKRLKHFWLNAENVMDLPVKTGAGFLSLFVQRLGFLFFIFVSLFKGKVCVI